MQTVSQCVWSLGCVCFKDIVQNSANSVGQYWPVHIIAANEVDVMMVLNHDVTCCSHTLDTSKLNGNKTGIIHRMLLITQHMLILL